MAKYCDKLEMYCRSYDDNKNCYNAYPTFLDDDRKSADDWILRNRDLRHVVNGVSIHEIPNDGFDKVVIRNLEIRGEGGRAYKVVATKNDLNFLVDLRENTLMETIKRFGIKAGGELLGKYVFISQGSQMNLVLNDSDAFKSAIADNEKRKIKVVPISELKFGHTYKTLSNDTGVFLGTVYDWSGPKFTILKKPIKKLLFCCYYNLTFEEFKNMTFNNVESFEKNAGRLRLAKNHSYRECIGEMLNEEILSKQVIFEIFKKRVMDKFGQYYDKYGPNYKSYYGAHHSRDYDGPYFITPTKNWEPMPQELINKLDWLNGKSS